MREKEITDKDAVEVIDKLTENLFDAMKEIMRIDGIQISTTIAEVIMKKSSNYFKDHELVAVSGVKYNAIKNTVRELLVKCLVANLMLDFKDKINQARSSSDATKDDIASILKLKKDTQKDLIKAIKNPDSILSRAKDKGVFHCDRNVH